MGLFEILWLLTQSLAVLCLVGFVVMELLRKVKVSDFKNKSVLITGCDTGFGYLLTKRLDQLGFKVFAGCLTESGAKTIKSECSKGVTVIDLNVTNKDSIKRARTVVDKHLPKNQGLWALVNNAGVAGPVAPTEWLTDEDFEQTLAVNLMGVIYVTKAFLPLVRKEGGRIVNMASICGRLAIATAAYNASKFGVQGFTDTLRRELNKTGCSVSVVEPGFFTTGIVNEGTIRKGLDERFGRLDEETKRYYGVAYKDTLVKQSTEFVSLVLSPDVHKVVDSYEHAITSRFPKARYTVGWDANFLFRFLWLVPDWFSDFLFGNMQSKPAAMI